MNARGFDAPLKYSTGFSLPFDAGQLFQNFDFVSLKNKDQTVTLNRASHDPGPNGLATTETITAPGGVKLFSTTGSGQGTVSYTGQGSKYFATDNANTTTQVATQLTDQGGGHITVKQSGQTANTTLATKLAQLSTGDKLLLAGVVGSVVLFAVIARR